MYRINANVACDSKSWINLKNRQNSLYFGKFSLPKLLGNEFRKKHGRLGGSRL